MITVLISCSIKELLFNVLIDSGSSIPFNIVSPNNTCLPMISTIFGIVICVRDKQSWNIEDLISLILWGIIKFDRDEHLEKTSCPNEITLSGMEICSSDEHPKKAL